MRDFLPYLMSFAVCCFGCSPSVDRASSATPPGGENRSEPATTSALGASTSNESVTVSPRPDVQASNQTDAWNTESISEEVLGRFQQLGQALTTDSLEGLSSSTWIAADFQAAKATTATWRSVYQDSSCQVEQQKIEAVLEDGGASRPPETDKHASTSHGFAAFEEQVRAWAAELATSTNRRAKFKVSAIAERSGGFEVEVLAHLSGTGPKQSWEINTTWQSNWRTRETSVMELVQLAPKRSERCQISRETGPRFFDVTKQVMSHVPAFHQQLRHGLNHWLDRFELGVGIIPTGYQGIAVGDVNGDGLDDLFVAQPGGVLTGLPNRLLVQTADGRLDDVSKQAGLDWMIETHGALFIDIDNDGDQDLAIATVAGIVFLENQGQLQFRRRSAKLMPEAPPISLAAADFDNDGDLDLYACCYSHRKSSDIIGRPLPYHDANNGGRNALFRNEGNWRFRNVTEPVGLEVNNRRFSFAASWDDFDNDGDQDLYVSNDYGRNNLFRNDDGLFTDVANTLAVEDISAGMSACWGDYDRDGWMDIYVGNMWSSAGNRIAYQRQFQPSASPDVQALFQRHARGNSLFKNPGAPNAARPFQDVSLQAGVAMGRWAWSSRFADINNDGWEDIVVANGFITQENKDDL